MALSVHVMFNFRPFRALNFLLDINRHNFIFLSNQLTLMSYCMCISYAPGKSSTRCSLFNSETHWYDDVSRVWCFLPWVEVFFLALWLTMELTGFYIFKKVRSSLHFQTFLCQLTFFQFKNLTSSTPDWAVTVVACNLENNEIYSVLKFILNKPLR